MILYFLIFLNFNTKNPRFYLPDIKLNNKEKKIFNYCWKILFEGYDEKLFSNLLFDNLWFIAKNGLTNCFKSNIDFKLKLDFTQEWYLIFKDLIKNFSNLKNINDLNNFSENWKELFNSLLFKFNLINDNYFSNKDLIKKYEFQIQKFSKKL